MLMLAYGPGDWPRGWVEVLTRDGIGPADLPPVPTSRLGAIVASLVDLAATSAEAPAGRLFASLLQVSDAAV